MRRTFWMCMLLTLGCSSPEEEVDPCEGDGALASCLEPTQDPQYYIDQSSAYFDTMDYSTPLSFPPYGETVARWEWPPWLKLTAYGREHIEATDRLLQLYPSVVPERECRFFDTQPFGRCRVVFYYDAHDGLGCPIYEEFVFNDEGEITWIEAWSDLPGMLPGADDDLWAEGETPRRLSLRVPGLGAGDGSIDLQSEAMLEAVKTDADLAEFRDYALDWQATYLRTLEEAGDDMWDRGCGW